jgi:hypothetical protein
MRLQRPHGAATNRAERTGATRGRLGSGTIRLLSVTAIAAATCSLWAGAASAATAHVTRHATKTSVSVSPKTAYTNADVKLSATVKGSGSRPTGTVTFWFGTRKLCRGTLSRGSAHCYAKFSNAATKTITGKYSGNSSHKASSGTAKVKIVNRPRPAKSATTTTITNANPGTVDVGKTFTFDVSVTSLSGTPTGTVKVTATAPAGLPADFDCTATLSGGKGSCTITAPEYGIVDYEATYSGDATHTASTYAGPYELAMLNVTTTTVGPTTATAGSVTLTAEVYAMGADIDMANGGTGTVTFYVAASPTATPTVACAASLLTSFNATTGDNEATCADTLATGDYYITAKFSGDPVNEPSDSTTVELVVS